MPEMAMGWVHPIPCVELGLIFCGMWWAGLGWVKFKHRNIKIAAWFFFVSYATSCSPQQTDKVCCAYVHPLNGWHLICGSNRPTWHNLHWLGSYFYNRIVCTDNGGLRLDWVTLQLPIGGLGWVGLRNLDPWPSLGCARAAHDKLIA